MLSSLSGKLSVLQTSSADNLTRQRFRGLISGWRGLISGLSSTPDNSLYSFSKILDKRVESATQNSFSCSKNVCLKLYPESLNLKIKASTRFLSHGQVSCMYKKVVEKYKLPAHKNLI